MWRTAWEALAARSPLSAAELVIVRDEHRITCLGCGHEYPGQLPRQRPACGGDGLVTAAAPRQRIDTVSLGISISHTGKRRVLSRVKLRTLAGCPAKFAVARQGPDFLRNDENAR